MIETNAIDRVTQEEQQAGSSVAEQVDLSKQEGTPKDGDSAEQGGKTPELNLDNLSKIAVELTQKAHRVVALSQNALSEDRVTESLLKNGDSAEIARMIKKLNETIQAGESAEIVTEVIREFSSWYEQAQNKAQANMRSLVGYFEGRPPGELVAQAKLFDEMAADVRNLQYYSQLI